MFGKIAEIKQKAADIKTKLSLISVEGNVNGVTTVADGNKKIISIKIDEELIKTANKEQIEKCVLQSVDSALQQAEGIANSEMKALMGSVLPGGLGNLFG